MGSSEPDTPLSHEAFAVEILKASGSRWDGRVSIVSDPAHHVCAPLQRHRRPPAFPTLQSQTFPSTLVHTVMIVSLRSFFSVDGSALLTKRRSMIFP